MIDVADPTEEYSAARYAREAAAVDPRHHGARAAADSRRRHRALLPRADARVLSRARPRRPRCGAARAGRRPRGRRAAAPLLGRVDPASAARIQPRDRKRLVRALEVYLLTGRPLTAHFAETRSPLPDYEVTAFALQIPADATAARVARRVDAQFAAGPARRDARAAGAGVPETAHPFTGLVYRQALEHLHGVRDEAATRELIVRENRRYSRRQLIWFRKEPNLHWIHAAGEREETQEEVARALAAMEIRRDATDP